MSDWTTDAADAIEQRRRDSSRDTHGRARRRRSRRPSSTACSPCCIVLPAVVLLDRRRCSACSTDLTRASVWAAWLTLGGIFVLVGAFCWTKRNP